MMLIVFCNIRLPGDFDDDDDGDLCHSFLIHPVEVSLNKKIHVVLVDGIQYVLNAELPRMEKDVYSLGVTLNKDINQDIYKFLME